MRTPWGQSDHEVKIAPGVTFYGTPSHGGIKLDRARNAKVPKGARSEGGWYEEDVEANIPWLVFFDEIMIRPIEVDDPILAYEMGKNREDHKHVTRAMLRGSLERWNTTALDALRAAGVKLED